MMLGGRVAESIIFNSVTSSTFTAVLVHSNPSSFCFIVLSNVS